MNEPFQLVTNCTFKGKDYLVQMCVLNSKKLQLIVTDKLMAEDWQCEYDSSYIEALTHKTGNFKQFDVFVMMLKSGLLKTSDCISLDLLTLEDLEELRNRKIISSYSSTRSSQCTNLNKRYLILTYSVEFDRIHYPLPLEYCGPPNPSVLQSNIRKLEAEIERLKHKNLNQCKSDEGETKKLKEKIKNLTQDNLLLTNEIHRLNKLLCKKGNPSKTVQLLQNSIKKLEERVNYEKTYNQQSLIKLKSENRLLTQQVEELKRTEKSLKLKLRDASRQISLRCGKRPLQICTSPDLATGRKKSETVFHPLITRNNSTIIAKPKKLTGLRKRQNKFLSSSSSESEVSIGRSRNLAEPLVPRNSPYPKSSRRSRSDSNERSRHSSADSKKKCKSARDSEGKGSIAQSGEMLPSRPGSRDSSLSSRCSSKQSKTSRFSNRGSGDHVEHYRLKLLRTVESNKEDLKFSMSDLETRIHALQKLLGEGLNI